MKMAESKDRDEVKKISSRVIDRMERLPFSIKQDRLGQELQCLAGLLDLMEAGRTDVSVLRYEAGKVSRLLDEGGGSGVSMCKRLKELLSLALTQVMVSEGVLSS